MSPFNLEPLREEKVFQNYITRDVTNFLHQNSIPEEILPRLISFLTENLPNCTLKVSISEDPETGCRQLILAVTKCEKPRSEIKDVLKSLRKENREVFRNSPILPMYLPAA